MDRYMTRVALTIATCCLNCAGAPGSVSPPAVVNRDPSFPEAPSVARAVDAGTSPHAAAVASPLASTAPVGTPRAVESAAPEGDPSAGARDEHRAPRVERTDPTTAPPRRPFSARSPRSSTHSARVTRPPTRPDDTGRLGSICSSLPLGDTPKRRTRGRASGGPRFVIASWVRFATWNFARPRLGAATKITLRRSSSIRSEACLRRFRARCDQPCTIDD